MREVDTYSIFKNVEEIKSRQRGEKLVWNRRDISSYNSGKKEEDANVRRLVAISAGN